MVVGWLTCISDSSDQSKALSWHPGVSGTRKVKERQVGETEASWGSREVEG